jgi:pimeloyl-ACP methyl ester carboxylesterase
MTHHVVELRDGRQVGVTGLGDPKADRLVLFCHPSPGAGGFDPDPPATSTSGVRIITLDRPGYGSSDLGADEVSPVDAWLDDVDEYLESIERTARTIADTDFGPIGVVGWGVGAVYAVGLAARHPELVDRVALVEPTGATRARRDAAASGDAVDARLDDPPALDRFAGASDRLELMLASARRGEGGEALDRRALTEKSWADSLTNVSSRTVTISSDDSDPEWYLRRVSTARGFGTWSNAATTIVEAWPVVLRFLTAKR